MKITAKIKIPTGITNITSKVGEIRSFGSSPTCPDICNNCTNGTTATWSATITGFGEDCSELNTDYVSQLTVGGECSWSSITTPNMTVGVLPGNIMNVVLSGAVALAEYRHNGVSCCQTITLDFYSSDTCATYPETITIYPDGCDCSSSPQPSLICRVPCNICNCCNCNPVVNCIETSCDDCSYMAETLTLTTTEISNGLCDSADCSTISNTEFTLYFDSSCTWASDTFLVGSCETVCQWILYQSGSDWMLELDSLEGSSYWTIPIVFFDCNGLNEFTFSTSGGACQGSNTYIEGNTNCITSPCCLGYLMSETLILTINGYDGDCSCMLDSINLVWDGSGWEGSKFVDCGELATFRVDCAGANCNSFALTGQCGSDIICTDLPPSSCSCDPFVLTYATPINVNLCCFGSITVEITA